IDVIADTLGSFADALTAGELARAIRQLRIQMRMGMDSVEGMMLYLGGRLDEPSLRSPDDWAEAIQRVSVDALRDWIRMRVSHRPLWTLAGPKAALRRGEMRLQAANTH
ncbi:MAG TPA: hypothetical protein VNH42_06045, partial [Mariprofundaceae bacterium]|nr:hypothetical protein [Mariprofundaceae bacterium]